MGKHLKRVRAALIGSGAISGIYLKNLTETFHIIDLAGCSDLVSERSERRAKEFGICQMTNEEILRDPSIEIVVNTTYPLSHYAVTKSALEAGKHVYTEKMLAVTLEEGRELTSLAKEKNLLLTAAPDTFLGGGWQTARKAVDDGLIGEPVAVTAVCIRSYQDYGDTYAEPIPFVFTEGGGIPFDMGGYYLHNMIHLFGPLRRVGGFAQVRRPRRTYENLRHPRFGEGFTVTSPNTLTGSLEFESGLLGSLTITSEAALFPEPFFAVHGTEGSLTLFDPNNFGGRLLLRRGISPDAVELPVLYPFTGDSRGIGVADMAYALRNGRRPRADVSIGYHAFEAVHGIWNSGLTGTVHTMQSTCERPKPFPLMASSGSAYEMQLND